MRIVVARAGGLGARALARDLRVSLETIYLWRRRYAEQGIDGLRSLSSPGRHSQVDRRRETLILRAGRARRLGEKAPSVAAVARATGISRATVRRLWDRHGLAVRSPHRPVKAARNAGVSPCSIVGIYIDPPWRVLARVAPTHPPRAGRAARAPRNGRRSEGASATSALLTALEAFGGDAWPRGAPSAMASARLTEVLARLSRIGGGAALEILAGPRAPRTASAAADARSVRDGAIHLVRARTHGAWLARATDWLLTASSAQEEALAGVFGHLMDYVASWRDGSAPFIWTPGPRPWSSRLPLRTA